MSVHVGVGSGSADVAAYLGRDVRVEHSVMDIRGRDSTYSIGDKPDFFALLPHDPTRVAATIELDHTSPFALEVYLGDDDSQTPGGDAGLTPRFLVVGYMGHITIGGPTAIYVRPTRYPITGTPSGQAQVSGSITQHIYTRTLSRGEVAPHTPGVLSYDRGSVLERLNNIYLAATGANTRLDTLATGQSTATTTLDAMAGSLADLVTLVENGSTRPRLLALSDITSGALGVWVTWGTQVVTAVDRNVQVAALVTGQMGNNSSSTLRLQGHIIIEVSLDGGSTWDTTGPLVATEAHGDDQRITAVVAQTLKAGTATDVHVRVRCMQYVLGTGSDLTFKNGYLRVDIHPI